MTSCYHIWKHDLKSPLETPTLPEMQVKRMEIAANKSYIHTYTEVLARGC